MAFERFGPPEVLELRELPAPEPAEGELLVRVHAVSVNRTHCLGVRAGRYNATIAFPHVLGVDPSGIVERSRSPRFKAGDRVAVHGAMHCHRCKRCQAGEENDCEQQRHIGVHRWGGYAEQVAVPAENAFRVPVSWSFTDATLITRHAPTAYSLARLAELQSGEWALVMGAAGALGANCVQVARLLGARVIAAAGTDERVATAQAFGAEAGVNYRTQDLASEVARITDGHGADVVFESVGDPGLFPAAQASLAHRGRLVTAGAHGGGQVPLDVRRLYLKRQRLLGSPGCRIADVERAIGDATAGRIRAVAAERVMPLADAVSAHALLEQNAVRGKIVLIPGGA